MTVVTNEDYIYLKKLISQGEHQQLDFKFAITDSRKIARSMVAFANTQGGTLLIGVKDNGKISGIRSEEEIYMVDAAASLYCRPEMKYKLRLWEPGDDKQVLEVIVEADHTRLWKAQTDDLKWKVWLRCRDQNMIAGNIWELLWGKNQSGTHEDIVFNNKEHLVFSHLNVNQKYTIQQIKEFTLFDIRKIEELVSDFIVLGLMDIHIGDQEFYFTVKQKLTE